MLVAVIAGAAAGCLGTLFGVGGGIFLVPVLQFVVGLSFEGAAAVSQITIIGTSIAVACTDANRRLANVRLAMTLQVLTLGGALAGGFLLGVLSAAVEQRIFGVTAGVIAVVMLRRLDKRNIILDAGCDVGRLGARIHDPESRCEVSYRVRRWPVAFATSTAAGAISVLGVGGGVLIVPVLNAWCGVPLRAAAAMSAFMIGATAIPGVVAHLKLGHLVVPQLAAAAVLGVLAGSRLGIWLAPKVGIRALKLLFALILIAVATKYLIFIGPRGSAR